MGKDESRQGDHKDVDETPENMSAASKTPKTPNDSVQVPTAADAVKVENCPTTQIRSWTTDIWRKWTYHKYIPYLPDSKIVAKKPNGHTRHQKPFPNSITCVTSKNKDKLMFLVQFIVSCRKD